MKYGFTLVELSIVLVIIGLLVGGILIGQGLIQSARVTALVSEVNQYFVLINQFKQRYKFLPGDSNGRGFTDSCGPYDGKLIFADTNPACLGADIGNIWRDLYIGGMVKVAYLGGYTIGAYGGTPSSRDVLPKMKSIRSSDGNDALLTVGVSTSDLLTTTPTLYGRSVYNYLTVIDSNMGMNKSATSAVIAAAVDNKMDDGKPASGKIAVIKNRYNNDAHCANGNAASDPSTVSWLMEGDGCYLLFGFEGFVH